VKRGWLCAAGGKTVCARGADPTPSGRPLNFTVRRLSGRRGDNMQRKFKLSPQQNSLLRLLEEAGAESLATALNSLGVQPSAGHIPIAFVEAVSALIEKGLLCIESSEGDRWWRDAVFDQSLRSWVSATDRHAELAITTEGMQSLVR